MELHRTSCSGCLSCLSSFGLLQQAFMYLRVRLASLLIDNAYTYVLVAQSSLLRMLVLELSRRRLEAVRKTRVLTTLNEADFKAATIIAAIEHAAYASQYRFVSKQSSSGLYRLPCCQELLAISC